MRIWSLHPEQLDRQGLTACWRETLLAQAVLAGRTRGYLNHPQLARFRQCPDPLGAVGAYLTAVADDADRRGYSFDRGRIDRVDPVALLTVTEGQVAHEWAHLLAKLDARSPEVAAAVRARQAAGAAPAVHPMMRVVPGPIAAWERVTR